MYHFYFPTKFIVSNTKYSLYRCKSWTHSNPTENATIERIKPNSDIYRLEISEQL